VDIGVDKVNAILETPVLDENERGAVAKDEKITLGHVFFSYGEKP
jgi:hypothetical protein